MSETLAASERKLLLLVSELMLFHSNDSDDIERLEKKIKKVRKLAKGADEESRKKEQGDSGKPKAELSSIPDYPVRQIDLDTESEGA